MNATQDAQPKSLLSRLVGVLVMVGVQALIFVVLLEVIARIIDPIGISYYDETARFFDEVIIEEPIGYRLKPGLKGNFNGVPVEINDLGMRDRPVPEEKAPGEFRLLAMGDSVIFSVGVPVEDSIPMQLERRLNDSAPEGRDYRVLNMGVPSYNTVQELEQLKQVGQHLQADAAFLFIIPNDLQDKLWVLEKRSNIVIDWSQRSYALGLIFYAGRWLAAEAGVYTNPNASKSQTGIAPEARELASELANRDEAELPEFTPEMEAALQANVDTMLQKSAWLDIENSLVEIQEILSAQGVPLLVFHRENFNGIYVRRMDELAEEHGFQVRELDVFNDPRWVEIDKSTLVNSPVDSHCNADGCALYAQRIHELLEETGLLQ